MRRSVALVLTIAILATISVCFLRPAPPVFGHTDKYFYSGARDVVAAGDTNLVRVDGYSWNSDFPCTVLNLRSVAPESTFSLGKQHYIDSCMPDNSAKMFGKIDKMTKSGSWKEFSQVASDFTLEGNYDPPRLISEDGYEFHLEFPICTPGRYRVTLFFREVSGTDVNGRILYTTQDELYSVQLTIDVPEATKSMFDLYAVDVGTGKSLYSERIDGFVRFALRANVGESIPYLDIERIECAQIGENGGDVYTYSHTPYPTRFYRKFYDLDKTVGTYAAIGIRDVSADCEYEMTLHFTENEDGSGEQYTLTLNLRFDE